MVPCRVPLGEEPRQARFQRDDCANAIRDMPTPAWRVSKEHQSTAFQHVTKPALRMRF